MFRSRFTAAFPKSLVNLGPQELERDIVDPIPGEGVEHLLCALLALVLNRKNDIKYVFSKFAPPRGTPHQEILTQFTLQSWTLWSRTRRSYWCSQIAMAKGLGGEEPVVWRHDICQHDAYRTSMSIPRTLRRNRLIIYSLLSSELLFCGHFPPRMLSRG